MAGAARVGDLAVAFADAHNCPKCPHTTIGPAVMGSTNVLVNGLPALRLGDRGVHAACCRSNLWASIMGSPTVLVNGRPFSRIGDATLHCGGPGMLVMGSPNVLVGMSGGASPQSSSASSAPGVATPSGPSSPDNPAHITPSHITETAAQQSRAIIQGRGLEHAVANVVGTGVLGAATATAIHGRNLTSNQPGLKRIATMNRGLGVVWGVSQLPKNAEKLTSEEVFSREWWNAASGVTGTVVSVVDAGQAAEAWRVKRATSAVVNAAIPDAPGAVRTAAVEGAMRQVENVPVGRARVATKAETAATQKETKKARKRETRRTGARPTNAEVATQNKTAKAAARTAIAKGGPILTKALTRFVYGVNVGIAALDTAAYVQTQLAYERGEVSMTKLVLAKLKMFASGAAAIPAPIVSIPAAAVGIGLDVAGVVADYGESL